MAGGARKIAGDEIDVLAATDILYVQVIHILHSDAASDAYRKAFYRAREEAK